MDKQFELNGITFIWDEKKARSNIKKHDGIPFEQAVEAFFDPFLKIIDASSDDEERHGILGMDTDWNLLLVVHIAFDEDYVRIISARNAELWERKTYED